jgi:hypothetical protein
MEEARQAQTGAAVFGYRVADPERYGVVDFDAAGTVRAIIEKPLVQPSNYAVTGLYFLDGAARAHAKDVEGQRIWTSARCLMIDSENVGRDPRCSSGRRAKLMRCRFDLSKGGSLRDGAAPRSLRFNDDDLG